MITWSVTTLPRFATSLSRHENVGEYSRFHILQVWDLLWPNRERSHRKYRFTAKFGNSQSEAFAAIKTALRDLVTLGSAAPIDFESIDANPLSQMFKAKILSLYYPDRFLAVCSSEHLEMLAELLGLGKNLSHSRYQNLLLDVKRGNSTTRKWSEPTFMAYLYKVYVRSDRPIECPIRKPRAKRKGRVDFEEIQKQRSEIGRAAEEYAFGWEKERLEGARLGHLIDKIEDRRDGPGYGHDFLSYSSDNEPRYIEVKCVAKVEDGHRFFLSDNEHETSVSANHRGDRLWLLDAVHGLCQPHLLSIPLLVWPILPRSDHGNSPTPNYAKEVDDVEERLKKDDPFDRVQDKYLLGQIKKDAHNAYITGILASHPRVAYLVIAPMGFVFSAYLFSVLIFLQNRSIRPSTKIASIYILLVSAALFWLYVVQAICSGLDSTFYDYAWSDSSFDVASTISLGIQVLLLFVGAVAYIKACWKVAEIINFKTHRYLRVVQVFGTSCFAFIIGTAFAYVLGMGVVEVAASVTEALDRWKLSS
jgi:Domain of unknown function (DUF3883)